MNADPGRVLFDEPGPIARRRARLFSLLSVLAALALIGYGTAQLRTHGQLSEERWQPFLTRPYLMVLWDGLTGTLRVTVFGALIAFPAATALTLGRLSRYRAVRWPATAYVETFRSVPLLLLIYVFLLALPRYGVNLPIFWKLLVPIVMVSSALIAEVLRAGVLGLDRGQSEAAHALGLRHWQAQRLVVLPQAIRLVLPALITQLVTLLKESTLGYAVSYPELMRQGDYLTAITHLLIQTYAIIAIVYVAINYLLGQLAAFAQRRLEKRAGGTALRPERPRRSRTGAVDLGPNNPTFSTL